MIRSGWANNCGIELFTHGWVKCATTDEAKHGAGSVYRKTPKHKDPYLAQALREDEEIILMIQSLF